MPYLTNSDILFSFASKNSSQNGQFFKTIPANFGGNKEKYLPLTEHTANFGDVEITTPKYIRFQDVIQMQNSHLIVVPDYEMFTK